MNVLRDAYETLTRWWKALSEEDRSVRLESGFPELFSYNSGKIENDSIMKHDTDEVFARGKLVSFTGDLRTVHEIENLRRSWDEVMELGGTRTPIDAKTLLHMHKTLTAGTYDERRWERGERPGSFKKGDYVVAGGVGYPPDRVAPAMEDALAQIDEELRRKVPDARPFRGCAIAAWAHAQVAEVHPFADGNGRVARALMNCCFLRAGLPPAVVFEQDRMAYYGALDAFHETGALSPLEDFLMAQTLKAWRPGESGVHAG